MKKTTFMFLLIILGLVTFSCKKDDLNNEPLYQIGEFAEGGIIFYIDETGQHGLVAATDDLSKGAIQAIVEDNFDDDIEIMGYTWGCYETDVIGAASMEIGTGYQNTIDILNQECSGDTSITAAQAALDYELNGFNDWYLPSQKELVEMFISIGPPPNSTNLGISNLNSRCYYWSSSEDNGDNADTQAWGYGWNKFFHSGEVSLTYYRGSKNHIKLARAIRSF